jgi:hypothetical protein
MKRSTHVTALTAEPATNLRVLVGFEPRAQTPSVTARAETPKASTPKADGPSREPWTVVDVTGSAQGHTRTRAEAVRLMSTLAPRMPGTLPLQVTDGEGHLTGDRLA